MATRRVRSIVSGGLKAIGLVTVADKLDGATDSQGNAVVFVALALIALILIGRR